MPCYYPHIPPYAFNPQAFIVQSINGGSQFLLTAKNPPNCLTNQNSSDSGKDSDNNNSKSSSAEKSSSQEENGKKALDSSAKT